MLNDNNPMTLEVEDESSTDSLFPALLTEKNQNWSEDEGQLNIDVAEGEDDLIIVATMAGTSSNKLELHLQNDLLIIRGERFSPISSSAQYFHRELFWGKFSRTIVLPVDVQHELAAAEYKNGILVVRLPKVKTNKSIPIIVVEE